MLTINLNGKTYIQSDKTRWIEREMEINVREGELIEVNKSDVTDINTGHSDLIKVREEILRVGSAEEYKFYGCRETCFLLIGIIDSLNSPEKQDSWTPQPGDMIEVMDEGSWIPASFIQKDSAGFYCEYCEEDQKIQEYFFYVRPLKEQRDIYGRLPGEFCVAEHPEDKPLPEFNFDWVMEQLEENQKINCIPFTALAVMACQIAENAQNINKK